MPVCQCDGGATTSNASVPVPSNDHVVILRRSAEELRTRAWLGRAGAAKPGVPWQVGAGGGGVAKPACRRCIHGGHPLWRTLVLAYCDSGQQHRQPTYTAFIFVRLLSICCIEIRRKASLPSVRRS